jgi:predicted nucleic acid-binding Zn ribbon protein
MQHIKALLSKRLKQTGLSQNIRTSLVIEEFYSLVGKKYSSSVALKIKPLYIKNKILTVACLSSVIASELHLQKNQMISQVNKKFNTLVLKDIKFVL